MGYLAVLLLLFFYSANCHEKRGIVESKYPFHNKPQQNIQKNNPPLLSFPSNYNLNPEFTNVDTSQLLQTGAQVPYSQYVLPYNNQYVNQPAQNLYLPYNQFQQIMGQLNTDFTKNVPVSQPVLGPKVGEVRTVGYQTQVYHPLHTNIHDNKPQIYQQQYQQQYQPRLPQNLPQRLPQNLPQSLPQNLPQRLPQRVPQQRQRLPQNPASPPPPKIYRNFRPIVPQNPAPVHEIATPIQHQQYPKNDQRNHENNEQNQSNEEINEDNEQQNEDQENEDQRNEDQENEDQREDRENEEQNEEENAEQNEESEEKENIENESEEREQFHPDRFFGNFKDDHQKFLQEDDHQKQDHEDSESRTKYDTRYKNNKRPNYKKYFPDPFKHDTDFDSFRGFKEPKVEYKMYKYSKSLKNPERREFLDGKESRNVPVVQHSQKSYKESWIISKSTSD